MYALMGIALGYYAYRVGLPLAVRSTLYPLIGKRVRGPAGDAVDIATVIGPRFSTASLAREQSFVRTASAAGVVITGDRKISTRLNSDGGRVAAEKLLGAPTPPRAIVCGSDEIAIGVMEHALSLGLRIPEDVAVVGSDGLPRSRSLLIGLTTIVQPVRDMAERSFELLLDQITRPRGTYKHSVCPHRLHIGRTCGCPPNAGTS